jgi:hypothetical protein
MSATVFALRLSRSRSTKIPIPFVLRAFVAQIDRDRFDWQRSCAVAGRSPKLAAFAAQNGPPDRFARQGAVAGPSL